MTAPEITVATPADRERVIGSLVAAFANDPVLQHMFPDQASYPRHAAAFFGHLFDMRVGQKTIWTIGQGASVAMWEAPTAGDAPTAGVAHTTGDGPRDDDQEPRSDTLAALLPADALARVKAYNKAVHAAMPRTPYWYLGVLATHPDHAGRRLGRAVMAAGLRRAAADNLPAVLETGNPANVEVYRRAGWEVDAVLRAEPLTIWIMKQKPTG